MSPESRSPIIENKLKGAEKIYTSVSARERLIKAFAARCANRPGRADVALVLGTTLSLYPDKFRKRVFTAVHLAKTGRISQVIFSGRKDDGSDGVDQALDAKNLAISEFGLEPEKILTIGGDNTNENLAEAGKLMVGLGREVSSVYVVSNGAHLIRALPVADYLFGRINIGAHPFPVLNEDRVDANDPRVIEQIVKAILYNRILNKNKRPVDNKVRREIDQITLSYMKQIWVMPQTAEISFSEWIRKVTEGK